MATTVYLSSGGANGGIASNTTVRMLVTPTASSSQGMIGVRMDAFGGPLTVDHVSVGISTNPGAFSINSTVAMTEITFPTFSHGFTIVPNFTPIVSNFVNFTWGASDTLLFNFDVSATPGTSYQFTTAPTGTIVRSFRQNPMPNSGAGDWNNATATGSYTDVGGAINDMLSEVFTQPAASTVTLMGAIQF